MTAYTAPTAELAHVHEGALRHARPFTAVQPRRRQQRSSRMQPPSASEGEPDLVSRWYGKIFGQKALDDRNPFGMKRLVTCWPCSRGQEQNERSCQSYHTLPVRMQVCWLGLARLPCAVALIRICDCKVPSQDADEAPEMFPATTDRFAEPVDGDDADAALVRPLMAGTRLERAPLRSAAFRCQTHDAYCFALCVGLLVETRYQNGSIRRSGAWLHT